MQPSQERQPQAGDRATTAGRPARDDHGRVVSATPRAAAHYRHAQRATSREHVVAALQHAVAADPAFVLALADLRALTDTWDDLPSRASTTWERHHIEIVVAAAAGGTARAGDLLREHLAEVGCDPLATRIVVDVGVALEPGGGSRTDQSGCHETGWPAC